jgi:CRP/FNR family transcriptional regulator, anaerobic regulatory protein
MAPSFSGVPFLNTTAPADEPILTDHQRQELARIGTRLKWSARTVIYREDDPADSVFAIIEGVLKSYRELPSGKTTVSAFLFPRDLFGLAERGRYVNSIQSVTRVTLVQLPLETLVPLVMHDPELQFQFLVKVVHELRESQRRAILVNRRDAAGRLAMFLTMMRAHHQATDGDRDVPLPMSRTDIANYLGLSREAMSRAAKLLQRRGIVRFPNRHVAQIVDAPRLASLAAAA